MPVEHPDYPVPHWIESVNMASWGNHRLTVLLEVATKEGNSDGPTFLECEGVEILKLVEEAVADRDDIFDSVGHKDVFANLKGFTASSSNVMLDSLKKGENFGEYVSHESRHYIVRSPYNCCEFVSSKAPKFGGYYAH